MIKIKRKIKSFFKHLGPGVITGMADNDPSGIAVYSLAGAKFGYGLTWMSLFLIPAMISVQEMCGRIGMVSGRGLAGVIKKYYSKKVLLSVVLMLAVANTINIGANLGIIAASMNMIIDFNFYYWLIISAIFIIWMEIAVAYKTYTKYLTWLGLILVVYIITAVMVKQDWKEIALSTLIPHIEFNLTYIMMMFGFLGTTISPYLFFWQTSQEVEENIANGKMKDFNSKVVIFPREIKRMELDTKMGMIFSNLIAFFIILTTAATLNGAGIFEIETPEQVAAALRPLAGDFSYLLFAIGIIAIGWQSIPVLAGSTAYALSEVFNFKEGLSKKFYQAKAFYVIIGLATGIGVLINLLNINVIKALFYSAIINGLIVVPLIAIIIKLADDERVVGRFKTKKHHRLIAWTTFYFMVTSLLVMLFSLFN